jgi:hypothetical protein
VVEDVNSVERVLIDGSNKVVAILQVVIVTVALSFQRHLVFACLSRSASRGWRTALR